MSRARAVPVSGSHLVSLRLYSSKYSSGITLGMTPSRLYNPIYVFLAQDTKEGLSLWVLIFFRPLIGPQITRSYPGLSLTCLSGTSPRSSSAHGASTPGPERDPILCSTPTRRALGLQSPRREEPVHQHAGITEGQLHTSYNYLLRNYGIL